MIGTSLSYLFYYCLITIYLSINIKGKCEYRYRLLTSKVNIYYNYELNKRSEKTYNG